MSLHVPAQAIHPGEILVDELEARGWTHEDLAAVTGISRRQIVNLTQGKSGITPETAVALAEAFGEGHEAIGWMNAQAVYELATIAQKERDIAKKAAIFNRVPVRELVRRGWISDTKDASKLESAVCGLLRVEKITDQPCMQVAARKSTSYDTATGAELAWYGRAFHLAQAAPASRFAPENIQAGLPDLMKLAAYPEDAEQVPRVLGDMGIRLVLLEKLHGTRVDGVAFWLDDERVSAPAIALSLRFDRIDNFWFTLLHELIHIKYKDASTIDVDTLSIQKREGLPEMEVRANREAADLLVPNDKLESLIQRSKPFYYEAKVVKFAQARGVHPGIVVGQLQNHPQSGFDYKQLRRWLEGVRGFLVGKAITDGWKNQPGI